MLECIVMYSDRLKCALKFSYLELDIIDCELIEQTLKILYPSNEKNYATKE